MAEIQSVAPPEIAGVCVISGLWGVGKTTLALTCEHPELTVMIDLDQKSAARCKQLGVDYYSPAELGVTDPLDYDLEAVVEWFRSTIKQLPAGKTTLIIDNGSPLEMAFGQLVAREPERYGVKRRNVETGSFGGVNPGVGRLWKTVVGFLNSKGYERIFVVMHMSQDWTNAGPVPNRFKTKGNKTLNELSNLSLILMRATVPGQPPAAIVAKEALGVIHFEDNGFRPVAQALPPRIPRCDWASLRELVAGASERDSYAEDEIPSAFEMSCYGQFMTPEQVAFIKAVADNPNFKMTEEDAGDAEPASPPPKQQPPPPGKETKQETMTKEQFLGWVKTQGWPKDEAVNLILERFGGPFKPTLVGQYKEHLQSFYGESN